MVILTSSNLGCKGGLELSDVSAGELGKLDAAGVERKSTAKSSTIPPMELEFRAYY